MSSAISPNFAGVSSFANDLQNVITRSVQIASMPLRQLQNQLDDLNSQSSALNGLNSAFGALQTALDGMSQATGSAGLTGESSDPKMVSAAIGDGAQPASYTVDVLDAGAYSAAISSPSLPAVSDPSSSSLASSSTYTLLVNGKSFQISPSGASLNALVATINGAGAGVSASLLNTGGSGAPSYRLVVRSDHVAADTIQLNDGSGDLLSTLSTGRPAQYDLNGLGSPISSNSRTVTLAPGVTLDLLKQTPPGEPVTITVSRDSAAVQTAVSKFVDAYNAAVDALDAQIGEHAGPLAGQSIVYGLRDALAQITQYTQTGSVSSLTQLGVTLDSHGKLSLNSGVLASRSPADIASFLGGSDTGGFLHSVSQLMKAVEDPLKGVLPSASTLLSQQIQRQNDLIAVNQQRIDELQANLQQQMSAADALLAQLETKKSYFNNLFTAMMNAGQNGSGVKAS